MAFVNPNEGDMDYGNVVGTTKDGKLAVQSAVSNETVEIATRMVVTSLTFEKDEQPEGYREIAAGSDKAAQIEYYRKLYSYSPDYVELVIQTINAHSFA